MERDEAIKKIRQMSLPKETMEILEALAPELKESRDEQIRKAMLQHFKSKTKEKWCNIPVKDIISWLEKQKEHQNNSDAPEKTLGRDLTFPQDKDKNLDEIAQDYVDGVKEYNSEPTWDLMQTAVCYGYHCAEQKEQKPAEWSEEDEKMLDLVISNYKYMTRKLRKGDGSDDVAGDIEVFSWLEFLPERFNLQPKAEWCEEDNIGWDEAFACVTCAEKAAKNEEELQNAVTAEKWLKEIKFKYYVHPVKQEWSEEDKKRVVELKALIARCNGFNKENRKKAFDMIDAIGPKPKQEWSEEDSKRYISIRTTLETSAVLSKEDYDANVMWLRDLVNAIKYSGPKPSWKPSEKQMGALLNIEGDLRAFQYNDKAKIIAELYEQLKRL